MIEKFYPDGHNIVVWIDGEKGELHLTSFCCSNERVAVGALEAEFPHCLGCPEFTNYLRDSGIMEKRGDRVVDILTKHLPFLSSIHP